MGYNARAEPLFCSLNLLFSDIRVAVAVVVILNSLLSGAYGDCGCLIYCWIARITTIRRILSICREISRIL